MRFPMMCVALVCLSLGELPRSRAADPLRLVPAKADAVAQVPSPRALYDAVYGHAAFQGFLKLDQVAALYDTTNIRRAFQFIQYFEKELGHERLELLNRLAGDGAVVAAQFESKAVLGVVQGKDQELVKKFVVLARKLIESELARQDNKEKIRTANHRGVETYQLGPVHAARAGMALLFSNNVEAVHKAIDLHLDGDKDSLARLARLKEIKGQLPAAPLAWGALNLEEIRKQQNVKNTLETLSLDPITTFAIGGLVDVIKRSPYVCAGLARDGNDVHLRVAMAAGRDGMAPLAAMFLPADERGSLPVLKPSGAIGSTSYFLDLNRFWENRHKILTKEQAKGIDKFEQQTGKYLKGIGLGTILQQAGKYHRVIVAVPEKPAYKITPTVKTGSFAAVLDMRDPAFAKSMSTILRGAALVLGFQYGLKMVEEKHGEHTLVTYYFPENGKFAGDDNNIRFNFNPCFTQVGDQFVIASTLELGKSVVDSLQKQAGEKADPATQQTRVYGAGLAANVRQAEDLIVSQSILSQALPAQEAKKQFEALVRQVERLGEFQLETRYGPREWHFDVRWKYDGK